VIEETWEELVGGGDAENSMMEVTLHDRIQVRGRCSLVTNTQLPAHPQPLRELFFTAISHYV
jgi:hypothetical protein